MAERNKEETLKATLEVLKQRQVRITPQRKAIIQYLIESKAHPSAEMIYEDLAPRFKNMSLATVYNNLRMLARMNLLKELKRSSGATQYDFAIGKHYHVVCRKCGVIVDLDYPNLKSIEQFASGRTSFVIESHQLEFYGLCPDCQKQS